MPNTRTPRVTAEAKLAKLQKAWSAGGSANTKAQLQARRRTGKNNVGRPARICTHCGERVKGGHVDTSLDESCGAHGWVWETKEQARKRLRKSA